MSKIKIRDTRNGNWFWVDNAVLINYLPKIGTLGFTLYSCLAMLSKNEPTVSSSYGQLGKLLCLSPRTIMRTIQTLIEAGLIAVEKRISKTEGQEANIYTLLAVNASDATKQLDKFTNDSNVIAPSDKPDSRKVTNVCGVTPPMTNDDKLNTFTSVCGVTPLKKEEEKNKKEEEKKEVVSPMLDAKQPIVEAETLSFPTREKELVTQPEPKPEKQPTNQQKLLEAFVALLRLDMRLYKGGYARLAKETASFYKAEITPEQVEKFAKWWYLNDFRGKQDQPPTIDQVSKLLVTALGWIDPDTIQTEPPSTAIAVVRPEPPQKQQYKPFNRAEDTQGKVKSVFNKLRQAQALQAEQGENNERRVN